MNLSEIETFLMIVKTKNITKTAENLFLSQPTVSHRLKSLENELQVNLITRKKGYKQIELTTQGEEFIPIAERWVSIWQEMQRLKDSQEKLYLTIGSLVIRFRGKRCRVRRPGSRLPRRCGASPP